MTNKLVFSLLIGFTLIAQESKNPAMDGFNTSGSDKKAIEIADKVMEAMGGRKNWDMTRYVCWKFFGRRLHIWDKWTGDHRFETDDLLVLMNLNSKKGKAWKAGEALSGKELEDQLYKTESAWINDSYWLFMPYKLKDSGLTLKYIGEGKMENGEAADILQLTFKGVGRTPENKYQVFVNKLNNMVEQWSYYANASDDKPKFTTPWANWQTYNNIKLSDNRGKNSHSDVHVFQDLPESVFKSPDPIDLSALMKN